MSQAPSTAASIVFAAVALLATAGRSAHAQRGAPWQAPGALLVDYATIPARLLMISTATTVPAADATFGRVLVAAPVRRNLLLFAGVGRGTRSGGFSHEALGVGAQWHLQQGRLHVGPRVAMSRPLDFTAGRPGRYRFESEVILPLELQMGRLSLGAVGAYARRFGSAMEGAPSPVIVADPTRTTALWRSAVGLTLRPTARLALRLDAGVGDGTWYGATGTAGSRMARTLATGALLKVPVGSATLLPNGGVMRRTVNGRSEVAVQFGMAVMQ